MSLFSTHRDTKLGHGDVVWMDTETHTLLDVGCKAPGLWWALTFLLSGTPGKRTTTGSVIRGDKYTHAYWHMHACSNLTRAYPFPPVGIWEKENVPPPPRQLVLYTFIIFPLWQCTSLSVQWMEGWSPQGWEQLHLKQWLLYMWKWRRPIGKEVVVLFFAKSS